MYSFLETDKLSGHLPPRKPLLRVRKETMTGSDMQCHECSVMVLQDGGSLSTDDTALRKKIGSGQLQSLSKP